MAVTNQMYVYVCKQLGGAVIPYDGRCYLKPNGSVYEYTKSRELVSQAQSHLSGLMPKICKKTFHFRTIHRLAKLTVYCENLILFQYLLLRLLHSHIMKLVSK